MKQNLLLSKWRKSGVGEERNARPIFIYLGVPSSWGPEGPQGGDVKFGAGILLSLGLILNLDQTGRLSAFCARAGTIRVPFPL